MSEKNFNNATEDELENVSGGDGLFKKITHKIKGLFSKKDKLADEAANFNNEGLMPSDDED